MRAKLIIYSAAKQSSVEKNELRVKLNGYYDVSHGGKYRYWRKGLLDSVSHIKPSRGTIIAPLKEADKILKLLRKCKAKIKTYDIEIKKSEFKK